MTQVIFRALLVAGALVCVSCKQMGGSATQTYAAALRSRCEDETRNAKWNEAAAATFCPSVRNESQVACAANLTRENQVSQGGAASFCLQVSEEGDWKCVLTLRGQGLDEEAARRSCIRNSSPEFTSCFVSVTQYAVDKDGALDFCLRNYSAKKFDVARQICVTQALETKASLAEAVRGCLVSP